MVLFALIFLASLCGVSVSSEPYVAWIKVPVASNSKNTSEKPLHARLTLASVADTKMTSFAQLNTSVCRSIALFVGRSPGGRFYVEGTRIINNAYDGPIAALAKSISNGLAADLLLETAPGDGSSFILVNVDEDRYNQLPIKMQFDVTTFFVNEGGEAGAVTCPPLPPYFNRVRYRMYSFGWIASLCFLFALLLIFIGMYFLS